MARKHELDLIPVNEAAARVRKHHRTIRRWIANGTLPAYRVAGWGVLVDRNDVDALVTPIPTVKSA